MILLNDHHNVIQVAYVTFGTGGVAAEWTGQGSSSRHQRLPQPTDSGGAGGRIRVAQALSTGAGMSPGSGMIPST
jgi:hypothetical protein